MVDEGLLKKSVVRKGDGADELINIAFKCNFDSTFIEEVAKKVDFRLVDF